MCLKKRMRKGKLALCESRLSGGAVARHSNLASEHRGSRPASFLLSCVHLADIFRLSKSQFTQLSSPKPGTLIKPHECSLFWQPAAWKASTFQGRRDVAPASAEDVSCHLSSPQGGWGSWGGTWALWQPRVSAVLETAGAWGPLRRARPSKLPLPCWLERVRPRGKVVLLPKDEDLI